MPKVLNYRYVGKKGLHIGSAYVGRPTPFGNPFKEGIDGNREEVVAKYRKYIIALMIADQTWHDKVKSLAGLDLICWCAPQLCHADVLLELANDL